MKPYFFIFIVFSVLGCEEKPQKLKSTQISSVLALELDTIDCCRPNMMGCAPCGRILIFKEPVTNELFCDFLNDNNVKVSMSQFELKNGKYTVISGLEKEPFQFHKSKFATDFTSWLNNQLNDHSKSDSTEKYNYSEFKIPDRETLKEFDNYGALEMNELKAPILSDSLNIQTNGSYLYLIRFGVSARFNGVEF